MNISDRIESLIGNTPLVELPSWSRAAGLERPVTAKIEKSNPGGSVKDRVARAMIDDALARGVLRPGGVIVEPTSGNTGVGLALIAASRGFELILTMPETMSAERRQLLAALGAKIELTPGGEGMTGAIAGAHELLASIPGAFMPSQFDNPANPLAHRLTTAGEIWRDTAGKIDILVAGVGTGGTLCGAGGRLKELNPAIRVYAVEPAESPVLSGGKPGPHGIQGIGAGFVPGNYDPGVVDAVIRVSTDEAKKATRDVARAEGLLVGISSGAALCGAIAAARMDGNAGKMIVAILPDTGERYLSTGVYQG
jgi:cysteine synthase A